MKSKIFYLVLLCVLAFTACTKKAERVERGFLSFDSARVYPYPGNYLAMSPMGWFSDGRLTRVDTLTRCDNQASVLIQPGDTGMVLTFFHLYNRDIVGDKVTFSGKYKYEAPKKGTVDFLIALDTYQSTNEQERVRRECEGSADWTEFSVEMPLPRTEHFYFRIVASGDMKLWVSDCDVSIDGHSLDILVNPTRKADKDVEFTKNSRVRLKEADEQTLDNLELLGKVWGFLKYYHPRVTEGNYNWDFELFRVLPQIAEASDKEERNKLLKRWVDKYGEIEGQVDYTVADSAQFHRFAPLQWLGDEELLGKELSRKLLRIRDAKRNPVFNYYLVPLGGKEEVEFTREKPYKEIGWDDQGYRILTLYRMWNAIAYCYPYTMQIDNDWSGLLRRYLPEFLDAASEEALNRSIERLAAEMNDSNVRISFGKDEAKEEKPRGLPLTLTVTDKGDYAVASTRLAEIDRGSVIKAVNGKTVDKLSAELRPLVPASNESAMKRGVAQRMFLTPEKKEEVTVTYKGREKTMLVPTQTYTRRWAVGRESDRYRSGVKSRYFDLSEATAANLRESVEFMKEHPNRYNAIIIDLRDYPKSYAQNIIGGYICPEPEEFMWYSMNSKTFPGNFFLDIVGKVGREDPEAFKGKVAILVDERTQNIGEIQAIAYRKAPNAVIIGTQTAGAIGHLGYLYLPRGVRLSYTMAGAFYPQWGLGQRRGVHIDIPVTQTVEDVEKGRDVWLDKAFEYFRGE